MICILRFQGIKHSASAVQVSPPLKELSPGQQKYNLGASLGNHRKDHSIANACMMDFRQDVERHDAVLVAASCGSQNRSCECCGWSSPCVRRTHKASMRLLCCGLSQ